MDEHREPEDQEQREGEEEVGTRENHEQRRPREAPASRRELLQIQAHREGDEGALGQPPERISELLPRACGQHAADSARELVQGQATTDVMLTQRDCGALAVAVAAVWLSSAVVYAADVDGQRLINADKEPGNWMSYHGGYKSWHYSSLDQINE